MRRNYYNQTSSNTLVRMNVQDTKNRKYSRGIVQEEQHPEGPTDPWDNFLAQARLSFAVAIHFGPQNARACSVCLCSLVCVYVFNPRIQHMVYLYTRLFFITLSRKLTTGFDKERRERARTCSSQHVPYTSEGVFCCYRSTRASTNSSIATVARGRGRNGERIRLCLVWRPSEKLVIAVMPVSDIHNHMLFFFVTTNKEEHGQPWQRARAIIGRGAFYKGRREGREIARCVSSWAKSHVE